MYIFLAYTRHCIDAIENTQSFKTFFIPECFNLQKAIQERREERRIRKENVEKSKRKQIGATKKSKQEDNEVEKNDNDGALDLLPSSVLKDVAREDEHEEEEEEYEREDDRRIAQRRLISEQLKLGLMQGKKRKFTEKRAGPVVVKTLGGVSSRAATGMYLLLSMMANETLSVDIQSCLIWAYILLLCRWSQGFFARQIPETPTVSQNA